MSSYQTQDSILTLEMNSHIWTDEVAGQKRYSYTQVSWEKDVKAQHGKSRDGAASLHTCKSEQESSLEVNGYEYNN